MNGTRSATLLVPAVLGAWAIAAVEASRLAVVLVVVGCLAVLVTAVVRRERRIRRRAAAPAATAADRGGEC